jgi:hypothetical protein
LEELPDFLKGGRDGFFRYIFPPYAQQKLTRQRHTFDWDVEV